jgi:chitodextrinase
VDNPLKGIPPKQRKVLVVVGVGAAAYVAWRWFNAEPSDSTTPVTSATDDDLAGTGIIGSNVGGSENVGNSSNTGADAIDTNNEWFAEAVERLSNGGWNAQAVQSALGDFLTGQSLSASEASIVRAAVGAMGGYPPNGPMTVKETPGVSDVSKLPAPTGLKVVSKTSSTVDLSWSPVTGAKQYRVYRSGASQNVAASVDTVARVAGLQPGSKYTFYVAAGLDSEKMGPRSSGLTVTTDKPTLKKVTGLKISDIGKTSARLTWTAQYPGEYLIRRSGSSQTWESVDNATTLTGLKPKTRYSYQVAAVMPGTRTPGPWSSYVSFTTKR